MKYTYGWRNNCGRQHIIGSNGLTLCKIERSGKNMHELSTYKHHIFTICGNCSSVAERANKKRLRSKKNKPETKKDLVSAFYKSAEWKRARYDALKRSDGRCDLCGQNKHDGASLHVDHIKPLRLHWDRRLDRSNLQILCGSCNQGKGNRDDTDWREPSLRVLMGEEMA